MKWKDRIENDIAYGSITGIPLHSVIVSKRVLREFYDKFEFQDVSLRKEPAQPRPRGAYGKYRGVWILKSDTKVAPPDVIIYAPLFTNAGDDVVLDD